jgi:hypothetical protein
MNVSTKTENTLRLWAQVASSRARGWMICGARFFVSNGRQFDGCLTIFRNGRNYVEVTSYAELYQALGEE